MPALGYLEDEGLRTNVFHLPVRGNGDGGIYTTAADVHALGTRCSPGASCPPRPSPRWFGRGARCRRELVAIRARLLALRVDRRRVDPRFRRRRRVRRPCAILADGSPTPSCATRGEGRGRSVNASTSWSQHRRERRRVAVTSDSHRTGRREAPAIWVPVFVHRRRSPKSLAPRSAGRIYPSESRRSSVYVVPEIPVRTTERRLPESNQLTCLVLPSQ